VWTFDFGGLAPDLARADDALLSGDPTYARGICEQVLEEVEHGSAVPHYEVALITAVVKHRIGVVQYQVGQRDEAEATFGTVDELLGEAQLVTDQQDVRDVLRGTLKVSRELRLELARGPGTGDWTCYATCQHGCRVAITPCGFTTQHC
jgi:hypothetical protein